MVTHILTTQLGVLYALPSILSSTTKHPVSHPLLLSTPPLPLFSNKAWQTDRQVKTLHQPLPFPEFRATKEKVTWPSGGHCWPSERGCGLCACVEYQGCVPIRGLSTDTLPLVTISFAIIALVTPVSRQSRFFPRLPLTPLWPWK